MDFGMDDKGSEKSKQQLSLFDFQMPKADFKDSSSNALDYDVWRLAHQEPEPNKTSKFLSVSAAIHAAALIAIAMFTVPLVEQTKTETITIEIEDVTPPRLQARGARVTPTEGATPVKEETPVAAKPEDVGGPGDVVVAKQTKPAKAVVAKASPAPKVKAKAAAKAPANSIAKGGARSVAPKTTMKAVPMTIDDIEAPELDEGDLAKAPVASHLNEDFNEDFEHIDQSQKAKVEKERQAMQAMAASLAADQDDQLNALDEQNKAEAEELAAAQNSLKQKNAQAIASALASEKAAAAREAAAREAALAAAQKRAGLGGAGKGLGTTQGNGAGNNGSSGNGSQVAGIPNGVRSLDQLRQMPGNPRPMYDREERLRGDQGEIAFIAYISKEGYPTKFRQMKSTGFANLDSKTLAALKKWRFYPGQEGWVELPFRWDLKGGMKEDGGLLRRSVSRR